MIYYFLLFSRYIDEDIYYPPRSRPLPSIGLHAQQFPEHVTTETETPRKHEVSHHKHAYSNNHVAKEQTLLSARVKRETRAARENRPSYTDFYVSPNGGLKIKTHYGSQSPYMDPRELVNI